jgi:dTDP-glucose 4,6-dehydratase
MRVLVTGSEGTLGRPLVRELEARRCNVWRTDIQHQPGERYVRSDIAEYRQIEQAIEYAEPDIVYHLAAEFGRINGSLHYEQTWKTNVIGTRHILELQRAHGFRLIFASSSEVYGEGFEVPLSEELTTTHPLRHLNDYATTKWVNEGQILNFQDRYGSEIMRLRFFNAYGPGEHYHDFRSVVCLFCYRALHGIPYEVYEGYHRVFMYVDDFIPTLANASERFRAGEVYNIGGEEYRPVRDVSDVILRTLGMDDSLVAYLREDRHNVTNKRPDISKAVRDLGHENTVTLEEGIPKTLEWMAREYGTEPLAVPV